MKLCTHNLLMCNKKTCIDSDKNYPLRLVVSKFTENKFEFDEEKAKLFYSKLDINALNSALIDINLHQYDLSNIGEDIKQTKEFWEYIHHVLFEYSIDEGLLVCQSCKREYRIFKGIPDMVLKDDEI